MELATGNILLNYLSTKESPLSEHRLLEHRLMENLAMVPCQKKKKKDWNLINWKLNIRRIFLKALLYLDTNFTFWRSTYLII